MTSTKKADLATREEFQGLTDRQIELNRQLQELNERISTPTGWEPSSIIFLQYNHR